MMTMTIKQIHVEYSLVLKCKTTSPILMPPIVILDVVLKQLSTLPYLVIHIFHHTSNQHSIPSISLSQDVNLKFYRLCWCIHISLSPCFVAVMSQFLLTLY